LLDLLEGTSLEKAFDSHPLIAVRDRNLGQAFVFEQSDNVFQFLHVHEYLLKKDYSTGCEGQTTICLSCCTAALSTYNTNS
jgi:hypothetical protein